MGSQLIYSHYVETTTLPLNQPVPNKKCGIRFFPNGAENGVFPDGKIAYYTGASRWYRDHRYGAMLVSESKSMYQVDNRLFKNKVELMNHLLEVFTEDEAIGFIKDLPYLTR